MSKLCLVAAVGNNGVIGKNNQLPWKFSDLRKDMHHFKALTTGHVVIMGRKTWDSLPNPPLSNRYNIVVTSRPEEIVGGVGFTTIGQALTHAEYVAEEREPRNKFIIGGSRLYFATIKIVDEMWITHVQADFEGDTYFPPIDTRVWKSRTTTPYGVDPYDRYEHVYDLEFKHYTRLGNNAN